VRHGREVLRADAEDVVALLQPCGKHVQCCNSGRVAAANVLKSETTKDLQGTGSEGGGVAKLAAHADLPVIAARPAGVTDDTFAPQPF